MGEALQILKFEADGVGADHLATDTGEGKATLLVAGLLAGQHGDLGVGDGQRHAEVQRRLAAVEGPIELRLGRPQIDHAELDGLAHLLGGQSDALLLVHGLDHVLGEFAQGGVEGGDWRAFFTQYGLVEANNRQEHGSEGKTVSPVLGAAN
jgi:hypothetical protein